MKLRRIILITLLLSMLFLSGCATKGRGSETIKMIDEFVTSWGTQMQDGSPLGITLARIIIFIILVSIVFGISSTNQRLSNMLTKSQRFIIAFSLSLLTVLTIKKSFIILIMSAYTNFVIVGFFLFILIPSLILFFQFEADEPWKKVLKIFLAIWCGSLCLMIGSSIAVLTTYGVAKSVGQAWSIFLFIPRRWLKCFCK